MALSLKSDLLGPGSSAVVVSTTVAVPGDYATLAAAVAAVSRWSIAPGAIVTIQLAAGTYSFTSPLDLSGLDLSQVVIAGAAPTSYANLSGFASVTGSAGAWQGEIDFGADASEVPTETYFLCKTAAKGFNGVWAKAAAGSTNNKMRLTTTHRNAASPFGTSGFAPTGAAGDIALKLATVLLFTGCDGIVLNGGKLGGLKNLVIAGNGTASTAAVRVSGQGSVAFDAANTVGLVGFASGALVLSGTSTGSFTASGCASGYGLCVGPGASHSGDVVCNGNNIGVFIEAGRAQLWGGATIACSNRYEGIVAGRTGSAHAAGCYCRLNNTANDLVVYEMGYMLATSSTRGGTTPTVNVVGNTNSIIVV